MFTRLIAIAARNLVQHQRGSLLWGTAAGMVTAILLVLFGFMSATHEKIYETATLFHSGHLNIAGIYKFNPVRATWMVEDAARVEAAVKSALPPGARIVVRMQRPTAFSTPQGQLEQMNLIGVDLDREPNLARTVKLLSGSLDCLRRDGQVLLSRTQAATLGIGLGDTLTARGLMLRGTNNAVDLEVGGIIEDVGSFSSIFAFTSTGTVRAYGGYPEKAAGVVQVFLPEPLGDLEAAKDAVSSALKSAGLTSRTYDEKFFDEDTLREVEFEPWTGGHLFVGSWEDLLKDQLLMLTLIGVLGGLAGVLLTFLACVGLSVGLGLAVRARTQEIGTLRAMGMQRGQVISLFVIEGFLLGLAASVVGVLVGLVTCGVLNASELPIASSWQFFVGTGASARFVPSVLSVLALVAGMCTCTVLASLVPSFLASRLSPILAMQSTQTGS